MIENITKFRFICCRYLYKFEFQSIAKISESSTVCNLTCFKQYIQSKLQWWHSFWRGNNLWLINSSFCCASLILALSSSRHLSSTCNLFLFPFSVPSSELVEHSPKLPDSDSMQLQHSVSSSCLYSLTELHQLSNSIINLSLTNKFLHADFQLALIY